MAENDVGGIGVKFTAEAAQLQAELQKLEQRLKQFDSAHGQKKVRLQAELVMPGARALQDFRRDLEKGFGAQGSTGRVKARIELIPPTAQEIKALTGKIGDVKVKVIGNFEWGKAPPKTVTVKVVEEGTGRPAAGAAPAGRAPIAVAPATAQAASTRTSAVRRRAAKVEKTTWTQADLDLFSLDALRDQIKGTRGPERAQLQAAITQREREGRTNVGGYTAGGYKASQPGGGGARGYINRYAAQTSGPLPRIADTGTIPLSSGAIRRMQGSGELPLPFARAGLYDPTVKRTSLTAKTMPSEEEIRSRTRQAMSITPRERMEAGERWWPEAARVIAGMGHGTGLKGPQMAGVAAMATNALDWPGTIRVLDKVFSRMRDGAREVEAIFGGTQMTGRDRAKAMDIIKSSGTSAAVEGVLRGPKGVQAPKVAEMFRGFMGDPNALPMDRHFQALTTGGEIPTSQIRRVREIVASEIRAAGRQPAGTMAGMWETIGGGEPFGPDPWGQLRARIPQRAQAMAAEPGGARGFANGDPYAEWRLREQRASMRDANKTRLGLGMPRSLDDGRRGADARAAAMTPEDIEKRNAELGDILFNRSWGGKPGGSRGFANQPFLNAAPRPLRLTAAGGQFRGSGDEVPVHHVDPRQLVPFRELDRERVPRLRAKVEFGPGGPIGSREPFDSGYLNNLTEAIKDGIKEPGRLEYDAAGRAQLTDGNHRLAAALRLVEQGRDIKYPVQAFPARGLLTGNTGRIATPNATDVPGIIGAGGPRGFFGQSPFGVNQFGLLPEVGGSYDIQGWQENQARMARMHEAVQAPWGGFTMDPKSGRFIGAQAGRKQGPWVSGAGIPESLTPRAAADPEQFAAAMSRMRANPANARLLAAGAQIGGFNDPEQGMVDIGPSVVNETASAALRTQRLLGPTASGAYNVASGNGLFAAGNALGRPETRIPGLGQPRNLTTGRFASNRDYAAALATKLATPATAGTGLDVPTYLRRGIGLGPAPATAMAAEPPPGMGAGPTLQEQQEMLPPAGAGGGGGGGRPRRPTGAGAGDDEVGQPRPGGRVAELLGTIEQGKYAIQAGRQAGQIRAAGTTVASQLGGLLGRGVDVVKINEMTGILGKMAKVVETNRAGFDALDEAKERGADPREIEGLEAALKGPNKELETLNNQFQKLQPNKFAQMATGLVSSIGGTIIGLGLFQGATLAIEGLGNALKEPADRLMGFRRIGEQTGVALGQMTRQMNGWTEGAVAATTAQSGLGDSVIKQVQPFLEQRAAVEAGNTAFKEQLDLIRSAGFFERAPGAGITQTTGGFQGTILGGEQPFLERFLQSGSPVGGPLERIGTAALKGAQTGGPIGAAGGLITGGIGEALGIRASSDLAARARGEGGGRLTEEETQRLDEFRAALATVNDGLAKANPQLKETAHFVELLGNAGPAADEAVAKTQQLLRELPGITQGQLDAAKDLRFALIDPNTGKAATVAPKGFEKIITEALRGVSLPSKEQAAFQSARQINAQLQLNREQGRLQRESMIPGQSFLSQLFAGRAPGGARGGVNIPNPLQAGTRGLPPEVLRGQMGAPGTPGAFTQNIDTSQLTQGLAQVETLGNKGRDALVGMIKSADQINRTAGVPSNLLQQFNSLTEAAGKTAATIRSISQASAWMQVNLQVKQINEQIFIMSRSLEDAKSFLSGAGGGELGLLQNRARSLDIAQAELGFRQQSLALANQELGISASTLQLQQRQRQINFQRAIAGFATPGQTPEEIAARQKEAGLEADFAQKGQDISVTQLENQKAAVELQRESLGISKEQFAVQQAMITVSAERAIGDLSRGIALLQEQARVTVQLQVNSEAIEAYQTVLEEQKAQIESVITEAYNTQQTILTKSAELIAQYQGTITSWQNMLLAQLANYVSGAGSVLSGFNPGGGTTSPATGTSPGGGQEGTEATGFFGSVSAKTRITVGEAGPETIAILRNPRSMTWGGNGGDSGGVNINVMVTGNNVGTEQDAEELAATIARKVEETMSRRSSLLGLRAN